MNAQYWVRNGSAVTGPYDQLQIRGLVAIGQLTPTMEISLDGQQWRSAGRVKGLFPDGPVVVDGAAPTQTTASTTDLVAGVPLSSSLTKRADRLSTKNVLVLVGALAVGVGVFQAMRVGSSSACSDDQAINLATSIIYEDIAKRTQELQLAAAMGQQVSDADLTAMELRIRRYINLGLSNVSTVGKSAKKVQCKAFLKLAVTPEGKSSDLVYYGKPYTDSDEISYSVRDSDDGKNIYVRIPAE